MSGWHEHFLDKYFAYRTRYVAAIAAEAPERERWAIVSEVARLGFVLFGCTLCALVLWVPVIQLAAQGNRGAGVILTALCALAVTLLGVRTLGGWTKAVQQLRISRPFVKPGTPL